MSNEPVEKRDDEADQEPVEIPVETNEESTAAPKDESVEQLMDRLMRLQAEFENFRKRSVRERAEWGARAKEALVLDLLPVVDSFDRALAAASGSSEEGGLLDGMILVQKQLLSALAGQGVVPIEALGEPFDPNLHDAFMSRPAGEGETPGTIVEEFATGYRMGERVVRATKGVVAAEPVADGETVAEPGAGSEEE